MHGPPCECIWSLLQINSEQLDLVPLYIIFLICLVTNDVLHTCIYSSPVVYIVLLVI
jgi:hypothetical protein